MRPKETYTYTITDIAILTEQEPNTIRQHIHRKKFNPELLGSVIEYINSKRKYEPDVPIGYIQLLEKEASENIFTNDEKDISKQNK